MAISNSQTSRIQTEHQLIELNIGFSQAYLAVQYLYHHLETAPETITQQTVDSFFTLLESDKFNKKKQAFFLYKEAAGALIHLSKNAEHPFAGQTIFKLQDMLFETQGRKHRAVSEALGSLPLKIKGPHIQSSGQEDNLCLAFESFLESLKITNPKTMNWHGRTLRILTCDQKIGCIKFARSKEDIENLKNEIYWLNFLKNHPPCPESIFHIPEPIEINGKSIFKFSDLPDMISCNPAVSGDFTAIAFLADPHYFHYPNDLDFFSEETSVQEVFKRNAHLLGKMAAKGIIHTALIPLFHNRVQQARRQDGGIYQWELGGRLDKWLESSQFPNFARSGLRDFEHIIAMETSHKLRHYIGEHLLSFILVLGSFFRNKSPQDVGFDSSGHPIDTRHLFDKTLFSNILIEVVKTYYKAITGIPLKNPDRFINADLVDNLIEKMGVDQHMEEILRAQDQINMSDTDFYSFLSARGLTPDKINKMVKGQQDIILNTGPHLGGFSQQISVPELIDLLFCLSSLCISDRYIMENRLKAFVN